MARWRNAFSTGFVGAPAFNSPILSLRRLYPRKARRNVERTLAIRWEAEQEEMIRRGDPREVLCMTDRDRQDLNYAVARIPSDVQTDAAAEQHVIHLLGKLSLDCAWWVAHLVAKYEEVKVERSKRSSTDPDRTIADALASIRFHWEWQVTSFLERLRKAKAQLAATKTVDPWHLALERVNGKIDFFDGLERVSSQTLLDLLQVPQPNRTAGTFRLLAKVMAQLGWTAVRVRDLTRGGYKEQVRGYCRDARNRQLTNQLRSVVRTIKANQMKIVSEPILRH
jgi:hypothetical protein